MERVGRRKKIGEREGGVGKVRGNAERLGNWSGKKERGVRDRVFRPEEADRDRTGVRYYS